MQTLPSESIEQAQDSVRCATEHSAYPHAAGYKAVGTSSDAAAGIESTGKAQRLREAVAAIYATGVEATADEIAEALGESILAIRPRVSELHTKGKLVETGERRRSDGGRYAHVWKAA